MRQQHSPNSPADSKRLLVGVALALCAGCSEHELRLVLRTPDAAAPSAALQTVSVRVLAGEHLLGQRDQPYAEGEVSLPEVEWRKDLWFFAAGLDASGLLVGSAVSRPELPSEPRACCLVACFCTPAQRDGGECTCGTSTCEKSCPP